MGKLAKIEKRILDYIWAAGLIWLCVVAYKIYMMLVMIYTEMDAPVEFLFNAR